MSRHPFRFGVMFSAATSGREWREKVRRAEAQGYAVASLPNHLASQPLAPMPALAAAAEATERLRVGTLVSDADLVHPAVLANEAATLDLLSDGRLELGLGAGWLAADREVLGRTLDPAGARIERLAEAIAVVRAWWSQERVTHEGPEYVVRDLPALPRPVQQPGPPLLVGGGGRRVLELAARTADIVGLAANMRAGKLGRDSASTSTGDATRQKVAWVREAAGDRIAQLELQLFVTGVVITDDRAAGAARIAKAYGVSPEEALDVPHALIGTVEQCAADLERRRDELGVSYLTVTEASMDAFAPVVERLAGR